VTEYVTAGRPLRQSLLRTYDACPLAAKFDAEGYRDYSTGPQALGSVFHTVAEAILLTLKEQGEEQIPTQEAVEILYEVLGRPDTPHLSTRQQDELRIMVLRFCEHRWSAHLIRSLEERLFAEVPCPDGQTRTVTGQPDVLMAVPPDAALCVDFKSGWAAPPQPKHPDVAEEWLRDGGRPYLSERGVFQLDVYGLLILRTYPKVQRVVLREYHVRIGETREAVLTRDEIEHVERKVGVLLQQLEETLEGRRDAKPRPGTHCSYCPRPSECPVFHEERREGAVEDESAAGVYADRLAVAESVRNHHRAALKAYVNAEPGRRVEIPGGYVGWREDETTGRRAFGIHKS
jgi:hypothetical protein